MPAHLSNVVTNSLTFLKNLENDSDEYYRKPHYKLIPSLEKSLCSM